VRLFLVKNVLLFFFWRIWPSRKNSFWSKMKFYLRIEKIEKKVKITKKLEYFRRRTTGELLLGLKSVKENERGVLVIMLFQL